MSLGNRIIKFLGLSLFIQVIVLSLVAFYVLSSTNNSLPDSILQSLTKIDQKILEGVAFHHRMNNETARNLLAYELLELNRIDDVEFLTSDAVEPLIFKLQLKCSTTELGIKICLRPNKKDAVSFIPVKIQNEVLGFLKLGKSLSSSFVTSKDIILIISSIVLAFALNIAFIFIFWLKYLKHDLTKITNVIRSGNEDNTIKSKEYLEIQEKIISSFKQINKAEEERIIFERSVERQIIAEKVAHDIRSPLTSLEFIVKNISPNLAEKERITANQALERISDILRTLGGKKATEDQSYVGLEIIDPLVERIISEKRLEFKTNNNIEMRLHNNIPYGTFVQISKAEFYRTMSNLINNSAEAGLPDKKLIIDIILSQLNSECLITIKDNGKGIPKDALSRVFQHGVSLGKDTGSGIGLTSAKETIEKYKGSLALSSEEGMGTIVTIKLPVVSAPRWFKTALKITTSNVCIIDDDDSIHSVWDEILSGRNLYITHIKSSEEFVLWFKGINKSDFSFLFDLELLGSKMNGLELIEKFNIEARSTLVTSHYDDKLVQDKAQKLGVKIIPKDSASRIAIDFAPVATKRMVLIDDDKFVHSSWELGADKKQIDLFTYFTIDDFLKESEQFSKDTAIYIDSNLKDGIRGEIEAKRIYDLGFENLTLASGMDFPQLPYWIKGNQGKGFPLV
jgi:signal transduction histidine kinase